MKIGIKLVCIVEVVALLSIAAIYLASSQLGRMVGNRVGAQLESVIMLKSNQISSYFNERINDIVSLANSEDITGLLPPENEKQDRETNLVGEKREKLQERLNFYPGFIDFLIIKKNGEVYLCTDKTQEGMLRNNNQYFIEGKKALYVDTLSYDISKSRPAVAVSAPVLDGGGKLRAVLVGEVDLASMSAIMTERSGLGETGETYLINDYNFVLTELRKDTGRGSPRFMYTPVAEDCLAEKPTTVFFNMEYTDYAGSTVFGAYVYLKERG